MTTLPVAVETIQRIEEKRDLLRYTVDGWSIWPIIRFDVVHALRSISDGASALSSMTRGQRVRFAMHDLLRVPLVRHHRYMIGTLSSGLLDERDGRYYDIFFDPLRPVVDDVFRLETVNNLAFMDRRRGAAYPPSMTTSLIQLGSGILSRRAPAADIRVAAEAVSSAVREELHLDEVTPAWVEIRLRYFSHGRRLYAPLLKRIRPQALLLGDQSNYALVAAARERGVQVIELQHGIADRNHPTYAWTTYARAYRRRMPLPDRIFLYGDHWRRELSAGGFWGDALRVTGSAHVDEHRRRLVRDEGTTVVFTAQGLETKKAAVWLAAAMKDVGPSVRLFVRLHPYYAGGRDDFTSVLGSDPRVQVLSGHESPSTYELLARAHLHVSISSSTHYDAVGLGVPTVILPFRSHEFVESLRAAGHAVLADTPEALSQYIRNAHEMRVSSDVSEDYFASAALDRIRRELHELSELSASKNALVPSRI